MKKFQGSPEIKTYLNQRNSDIKKKGKPEKKVRNQKERDSIWTIFKIKKSRE
ncbi:MAG: hypothetical protein HY776_00915 [Actinobacteria bacterium]|nr:hypothetical protein [Actinomycetota bacterium]